ncbi:MAG: YcaO-like family protein [Acidobacteriota bacterium]
MKIKIINKKLEFLPNLMNAGDFWAIEEALRMYNPIVGPIKSITSQFNTPCGVPIYCFTAHHFDFHKVIGKKVSKDFIPAGGKGRTLWGAFMGTLGEAIERFLPLISYDFLKSRIVYGTPKGLQREGYEVLGPDRLYLFAKEQYKKSFFKQFTEDTYLGWIDGENVLTKEKIYAPAQLIIFGYKPVKGEIPIGYAVSGGLTCHTDEEEGRYHGFTEFIERDQLNIRWVCGFPPKEVVLDSDNFALQKLMDGFFFFDNPYVKMKIYHWSLDLPEVHVLSIHCVNTSSIKVKYLPGVGSDVSFYHALRKALAELGQADKVYFTVASGEGKLPYWMDISPDAKFEEVSDLFKTIAYYGFDKNLKKVEDFYNRSEKVQHSSLVISESKENGRNKYQKLLKILKEKKLTPLCFDLTPPCFQKLKLQRCFIPELTMYFIVHGYYGHIRYYNLGKELGLVTRIFSFDDLNKAPLPFP